MGFSEAKVSEGPQLGKDRLYGVGIDPASRHALRQAGVQGLHPLGGALGAHGPAQSVGLGGAEPGDVHGDLHELFLKERHSQDLGQSRAQALVQVDDRLAPQTVADVGVDSLALD